jgi:hypothetical protein
MWLVDPALHVHFSKHNLKVMMIKWNILVYTEIPSVTNSTKAGYNTQIVKQAPAITLLISIPHSCYSMLDTLGK